MSILWDVAVKEKTEGYYVLIIKVPHGNPIPENMIRIARNISEDEAKAIMNQYPQATQAKC